MFQTELVAELPHLLQGFGREVELLSRVRVDGVDHEVGVGMFRVHMGGRQHLTAGEEPLRQLQGDLVGLRRSHVFLRREGLDVVVEEGAAGLAVEMLGGHKALLGQRGGTVDTGEIPPAVLVHGLFLLGDVAEHPAHGAGGLLPLLDKATRRRGKSPGLSK